MAIDLVAIVKKPRWRDVCLTDFSEFSWTPALERASRFGR
jgi:hypothetical protein